MDRTEAIRKYFDAWLNRDRKIFDDIFNDETIYVESYGPVYKGINRLKSWFDDWNRVGKVTIWDIKNFYFHENTIIVEWYFECVYNKETDGFDGVSVIEFNAENKIISVKEFMSKAEHYFPYE